MQINISHKATIQNVPQLNIFSSLFLSIIFVCTGSSLLFMGFSLVAVSGGLLSNCSAEASHCGGFFGCRAWALDALASVVAAYGLSS